MAIFSKEMCRQKLNTWLAAEESVSRIVAMSFCEPRSCS